MPSPKPISPLREGVSLPWQEPLDLAARFSRHGTLVLLHAAMPSTQGMQRSWLALSPLEIITSWSGLEQALHASTDRWFGYITYESEPWFARFECLYLFDHTTQQLTRVGNAPAENPTPSADLPLVASLTSNMSKQEYVEKVEATIEQIHAGEFYQANITRKFYGGFASEPDAFALYRRLCEINPAAYSAYIKNGDIAILSSSPECFLKIDANGQVESRPIKGTARHREDLEGSSKNQAENLMIVDLMRNDLAHACLPGSIAVDNLFAITEHPTLYHMVSTIRGQKLPEVSTLSLIRDCFPPGSMTGAPKKHVVEWCRKMEQLPRGIYSGALGWMHGDGSADLSVVIRTLILAGNRFEFQVGGGIVADSTPEEEWEETLTKASALARTLGIELEQLRGL